ncbi:hypothetical protein, partial [Palleronia sp.]|uniref:hypothetical protein n=1 Tax=Palleronia sp. TaxID=1940284 RepID=UPI0035C8439C
LSAAGEALSTVRKQNPQEKNSPEDQKSASRHVRHAGAANQVTSCRAQPCAAQSHDLAATTVSGHDSDRTVTS